MNLSCFSSMRIFAAVFCSVWSSLVSVFANVKNEMSCVLSWVWSIFSEVRRTVESSCFSRAVRFV